MGKYSLTVKMSIHTTLPMPSNEFFDNESILKELNYNCESRYLSKGNGSAMEGMLYQI